MIRHLFTLMWNRKRANALLIAEIFLAFVVLFAVCSVGAYYWRNYRAPLGFTYQDVWQVDLNPGALPAAEQVAPWQRILRQLRATPGVEVVSRQASNTPFAFSNNNGTISAGTGANKRQCDPADFYEADPEMQQALGLQLKAGRWFDRRDETPTRRPPVVITEAAAAALFPSGESPLGQTVGFGFKGDEEHTVIGVSGPYRAGGELSEPQPAMFRYVAPLDTSRAMYTLLVRVKPGSGAALEKRLSADIRAAGPTWTSTITVLADQRITQLKLLLIPPLLLSVVCLFLIVNVALGLFGVLWLNINQRRSELGVRRALGATAGAVSGLVLGEILVLTTFGLALGMLAAVQFPLLGVLNVQAGVYFTAMLLAAAGLYGLATACALYPSRLAAGIQPAVALREE